MFEQYFHDIGSSLLSLYCEELVTISHSSNHLNSSVSFNRNIANPKLSSVFTEKLGILAFCHNDEETAISLSPNFKKISPTFSYNKNYQESNNNFKIHLPYSMERGKLVFSDNITINNSNNNIGQSSLNNLKKTKHAITAYAKGHHSFHNVSLQGALVILPTPSCSLYLNFRASTFYLSLAHLKQQIKGQLSRNDRLFFIKLTRKPMNDSENDLDNESEEEEGEHFNNNNLSHKNDFVNYPFVIVPKLGVLFTNKRNILGAYYKPTLNTVTAKTVINWNKVKFAANFEVSGRKIIPSSAISFKFPWFRMALGAYGDNGIIANEITAPLSRKGIIKLRSNFSYLNSGSNSFSVLLNFDH